MTPVGKDWLWRFASQPTEEPIPCRQRRRLADGFLTFLWIDAGWEPIIHSALAEAGLLRRVGGA